ALCFAPGSARRRAVAVRSGTSISSPKPFHLKERLATGDAPSTGRGTGGAYHARGPWKRRVAAARERGARGSQEDRSMPRTAGSARHEFYGVDAGEPGDLTKPPRGAAALGVGHRVSHAAGHDAQPRDRRRERERRQRRRRDAGDCHEHAPMLRLAERSFPDLALEPRVAADEPGDLADAGALTQRLVPGAPVDGVPHQCVGDPDPLRAGRERSLAEIGVLAVDVEAPVETADTLEQRARIEHVAGAEASVVRLDAHAAIEH